MDSLKIVLAGDAGVGKTSLLLAFADERVLREYVATIGVDFRSKVVLLGEKSVKVNLWDTAGQERYRGITGAYYRGAHVVLLVYDITREETFANLHEWVQTVQNKEPDAQLVIVGNKADLEARRAVSQDAAERFAAGLGAPHWLVTVHGKTDIAQQITDFASQLPRRIKAKAGFQLEKEKAKDTKTSCSC